jgi:hypothetical protein
MTQLPGHNPTLSSRLVDRKKAVLVLLLRVRAPFEASLLDRSRAQLP